MIVMKSRYREVVKKVGTCISLLMLASCSSNQLPNELSLSIAPDGRTVAITTPAENAVCRSTNFPYLDVPIQISVRDGSGSPLGGVPVSVYADWAANSSRPGGFVSLLYDFNGDGVNDAETETVTQSNEAVFRIGSNRSTGDVVLTLRLNLGCAYRGELVAFAGGRFASTPFSVTYETDPPIDEPEPETTDLINPLAFNPFSRLGE